MSRIKLILIISSIYRISGFIVDGIEEDVEVLFLEKIGEFTCAANVLFTGAGLEGQ